MAVGLLHKSTLNASHQARQDGLRNKCLHLCRKMCVSHAAYASTDNLVHPADFIDAALKVLCYLTFGCCCVASQPIAPENIHGCCGRLRCLQTA